MVAREAHRQNKRDDLVAEIDRFLRWLAKQEIEEVAQGSTCMGPTAEKVKDEDEYERDD